MYKIRSTNVFIYVNGVLTVDSWLDFKKFGFMQKHSEMLSMTDKFFQQVKMYHPIKEMFKGVCVTITGSPSRFFRIMGDLYFMTRHFLLLKEGQQLFPPILYYHVKSATMSLNCKHQLRAHCNQFWLLRSYSNSKKDVDPLTFLWGVRMGGRGRVHSGNKHLKSREARYYALWYDGWMLMSHRIFPLPLIYHYAKQVLYLLASQVSKWGQPVSPSARSSPLQNLNPFLYPYLHSKLW